MDTLAEHRIHRLSDIYARDRNGPGPALLAVMIIAIIILVMAQDLALACFQLGALGVLRPGFLTEMLARLNQEPPRGSSAVAYAVRVTIVTPIIAELLFRGVFLPRLSRRIGAIGGAVASSLFFAAFHLNMLGAFVFGLVLCSLARRTRSLLVPTLAHMINNAVAVAIDLIAGVNLFLPFDRYRSLALPAVGVAILSLTALWFCLNRFFPGSRAPRPGDKGPDKPEPAGGEPIEAYLLSVDIPGPCAEAEPDGREAPLKR